MKWVWSYSIRGLHCTAESGSFGELEIRWNASFLDRVANTLSNSCAVEVQFTSFFIDEEVFLRQKLLKLWLFFLLGRKYFKMCLATLLEADWMNWNLTFKTEKSDCLKIRTCDLADLWNGTSGRPLLGFVSTLSSCQVWKHFPEVMQTSLILLRSGLVGSLETASPRMPFTLAGGGGWGRSTQVILMY